MKHSRLHIGGLLVQLLPESPSGTIWLITMLVIVGAVRGEDRCLGNTSSPTPTPANCGYRGWGRAPSELHYLSLHNNTLPTSDIKKCQISEVIEAELTCVEYHPQLSTFR